MRPAVKPWLDQGQLPADMALGRIYGRLRIVGYEVRGVDRRRRRYVICVCLCGSVVTVSAQDLRRPGHTQSCGCVHKERAATTMRGLWVTARATDAPFTMGRPKRREEQAA